MARLALIVAVAVLAGPAHVTAQSTADPIASELRWVRGVVISLSPETAVLQLRSDNIMFAIEPSVAASLRLNGIAEVHYTDKNDVRRAVLVFADAVAGAQELSKRPGHSYRGVIKRVKRDAVDLLVANETRELALEKGTRLTDAQGAEIAVGSKAIQPLLAAHEPVLVKYDGNGVSAIDYSEDAIEIRRLPGAAGL